MAKRLYVLRQVAISCNCRQFDDFCATIGRLLTDFWTTFGRLSNAIWTTFASRLDHFLDDSGATFVNHPVRRGRSRNSITIPHRGASKTIPKTLKKLLRGREIESRNAWQQPKHASKNDRKYEQKHKTKAYPIPQASRAFPIGKPSCDLDLAGPPVAV